MTTHNPPSDCVGHCVGTASETGPPGIRETTASAGPLHYVGPTQSTSPHHCVGNHCVTASQTSTTPPARAALEAALDPKAGA